MKKAKGILKVLTFLAVVIIVALILQITPVADWVGKITGVTGDKIKSAARTVITIALAAVVVSWGVASLAVPILGVSMVLIGLVMLAWSVYPMIVKPKPADASNSSFNQAGPFKLFM